MVWYLCSASDGLIACRMSGHWTDTYVNQQVTISGPSEDLDPFVRWTAVVYGSVWLVCFCLLIYHFLNYVSIKPMTTMLVFLRCVCVCGWVECLWVCVRVWVWHAYLLCERPGLS